MITNKLLVPYPFSHIAFPIFPISFILHPWSLIPLYTHTKQNKANRELSVVCLSVCEFLCLWIYFLKIICWEKCWKKRNSWKIIYFFARDSLCTWYALRICNYFWVWGSFWAHFEARGIFCSAQNYFETISWIILNLLNKRN